LLFDVEELVFVEPADEMAVVRPNFLIAGAGKAGTTSLHEYLCQHPDIFMSAFKEPSFFVTGYGYDNWEDYLALFAGARGEKAAGESSTAYLYCEESPAWIKSLLGNVRIILILRNPAQRAASLYWWMLREGYENAPTFAEALELESSRTQNPNFRSQCPQFYPDYLYYRSGLYSEQVRRYLDTFGEGHVRIYIFEEFIKRPLDVCRDIFEFLDVDPSFRPTMQVYNRAQTPASVPLQYWLRTKGPHYLRFVPSRLRQKLLLALMKLNARKGSLPTHDPELEKSLLERYRSDITKLERLIDRDLSMWYEGEAKPL
jgi:Sulfotransferase domain